MSSSSLLIFARLSGFFLLSPLFSKKNIPSGIRLGFAAVCTLVLAPPLSFHIELPMETPLFWITMGKETAIGYLLGFLFSLLFEAGKLAGQVVGTMAGFSITELFGAGEENSIFSKLFALTLFTLFLALDLHHHLLHFLFESFSTIPVLPNGAHFAEASSRLFAHALHYAYIPFTTLFILLVTFAVIARALPDLQIFWVGFPLQLLIGMVALAVSLSHFGEILQKAFFEFLTFAKTLFFPL